MLIPPKEGKEEESKEHDGKKWTWCKHHEKWLLLNGRFGKHTSELCSLNPKNKDKKMKAAKDGEVQVNQVNVDSDDEEDVSTTSGASSSSDEE
jgi:hypothetical protein